MRKNTAFAGGLIDEQVAVSMTTPDKTHHESDMFIGRRSKMQFRHADHGRVFPAGRPRPVVFDKFPDWLCVQQSSNGVVLFGSSSGFYRTLELFLEVISILYTGFLILRIHMRFS